MIPGKLFRRQNPIFLAGMAELEQLLCMLTEYNLELRVFKCTIVISIHVSVDLSETGCELRNEGSPKRRVQEFLHLGWCFLKL